jgi:hypothetical protein
VLVWTNRTVLCWRRIRKNDNVMSLKRQEGFLLTCGTVVVTTTLEPSCSSLQ